MAKKSFYDKFDDIPAGDREDYVLQNGKYVLQLDGLHPTQIKNAELLGEKATREADKQTAVQQAVAAKDAEITRLTGELTTVKAQGNVLPHGQVAVAAEKVQLLNQFEALGEFKAVKEKLDEHGTLKANQATEAKHKALASIAVRNGYESEAFTKLGMLEDLSDKIESRQIKDAKGADATHDFVKTKNADGTDKTVALADYVKENETFKPFLPALNAKGDTTRKVVVPKTGIGDPPVEKSAAAAYLGSAYKRPDK